MRISTNDQHFFYLLAYALRQYHEQAHPFAIMRRECRENNVHKESKIEKQWVALRVKSSLFDEYDQKSAQTKQPIFWDVSLTPAEAGFSTATF